MAESRSDFADPSADRFDERAIELEEFLLFSRYGAPTALLEDASDPPIASAVARVARVTANGNETGHSAVRTAQS